MRAVIAGPDPEGLGAALAERGVTVTRAGSTATREALRAAGVGSADLFVLTDAGLATSIPVALEENPELRVVCYTADSLPDFVSGQAGHVVDPALISPGVVAEELLADA